MSFEEQCFGVKGSSRVIRLLNFMQITRGWWLPAANSFGRKIISPRGLLFLLCFWRRAIESLECTFCNCRGAHCLSLVQIRIVSPRFEVAWIIPPLERFPHPWKFGSSQTNASSSSTKLNQALNWSHSEDVPVFNSFCYSRTEMKLGIRLISSRASAWYSSVNGTCFSQILIQEACQFWPSHTQSYPLPYANDSNCASHDPPHAKQTCWTSPNW